MTSADSGASSAANSSANVSPKRRGLLIGAGYFSEFHLDAWQRLAGAEIVCICDLDEAKARRAADRFGVADVCCSVTEALKRTDLDFVDIATAPVGRLEIVQEVIERGLPIICQKPLAADFETSTRIIDVANASGLPFMVHENFRFQPWYREIKRLLNDGTIGLRLHSITMRSRLGDGWGHDAYLSRQPYFRTMPRLLVHETGVHFADTFRYLAGDVVECSAALRRLNDVIVGEDTGLLQMRFAGGVVGVWDANRYNESLAENPRYTFGELLVEADGGSLWLNSDGSITIKLLGQPACRHDFTPSTVGFGGDCVYACQQHFLDVLDGRVNCETSPSEYLKSLQIVEALYESSQRNRPVSLPHHATCNPTCDVIQKATGHSAAAGPRRRVIDLSLPVSNALRGVEILPNKSLHTDGWNATTLSLYSHSGTHMDAPKHFLPEGKSLDQQDLSVCIGSARIVNLAPATPRQLLTVDDVINAVGEVHPGDRLLFRTDWSKRFGTPEYRDQLPRISLELAEWLVKRRVAMIGVEPPSVADVNNMQELTDVHQTLFRGRIMIVEGLTNLDQITLPEVEFIALPLNIMEGDGCPVRAIAVENSGVKS